MAWFTKNLGWIIAALALLVGGAIGYGRVQYITTQVASKADREDVVRELDLIHGQLASIERKLDAALGYGK